MTDSGGRNVGTTATTSSDTPSSVGAAWRRADIQGLRAIAVLSVVAFHAELPIPGGFTGVDVFFVISGYVITLLLLREQSKGSFSFAMFYARRAQRLLPALAAMVATVFVISWLIESPFGAQQTTAATGIGAMLLAANVVIVRSVGDYFDSVAEANPLLNTWSLSVEEQFYLVFPLLVIFAAVKFRRHTGLFLTVALLTGASFVLSVALTGGWSPGNLTSQPEAWAFYLSPARAWEFGVGALLAIGVGRHRWTPTATQSNVLAITGLTLLAASFWWITPDRAFPGTLALLPVLGTAALIAAGLTTNPTSRLCAHLVARIRNSGSGSRDQLLARAAVISLSGESHSTPETLSAAYSHRRCGYQRVGCCVGAVALYLRSSIDSGYCRSRPPTSNPYSKRGRRLFPTGTI